MSTGAPPAHRAARAGRSTPVSWPGPASAVARAAPTRAALARATTVRKARHLSARRPWAEDRSREAVGRSGWGPRERRHAPAGERWVGGAGSPRRARSPPSTTSAVGVVRSGCVAQEAAWRERGSRQGGATPASCVGRDRPPRVRTASAPSVPDPMVGGRSRRSAPVVGVGAEEWCVFVLVAAEGTVRGPTPSGAEGGGWPDVAVVQARPKHGDRSSRERIRKGRGACCDRLRGVVPRPAARRWTRSRRVTNRATESPLPPETKVPASVAGLCGSVPAVCPSVALAWRTHEVCRGAGIF